MSQGTAPPDPPFAGGRDLGRQQRAIFCRMPLLSYPWKLRGHIIFSRQDHSPSADWTSSPVQGAGLNRNTPLVPFFALPPNFAFGAEGHLLGRQCAIFRRVPFLGQSGKLTGQIIDAWSHSTVGTHRTAAAICAGVDGCTPHMAMAAPPPYLFLTSRQHTLRRQRQIFGGVPFSCQFRELTGQVGFSGPRSSAGAVRAIGVAGGAVVHRYLPAVAFFTLPPHLFRASVGNGFRGKGKIGLTIPLGKQFCTAFRMAEGR